jgi:hypothetical protein
MPVQILAYRHMIAQQEALDIRDNPGFAESRIKAASYAMAHEVFKLATVKEFPVDAELMTQTNEYSVLIGDARDQKAVAEAVEKRATELANEMLATAAAKAIAGIENWGSYYGHSSISKDQAILEIRTALRSIK